MLSSPMVSYRTAMQRATIPLGEELTQANEAGFAMLADGIYARMRAHSSAMLLFGEERRQAARELWKAFSTEDGLERIS